MARGRVLQVRMSEEEYATVEQRAGKGEISAYVRSAAVDRIAPDVAADLRGLFRIARAGGPVGEAASKQVLERVMALCGIEETHSE